MYFPYSEPTDWDVVLAYFRTRFGRSGFGTPWFSIETRFLSEERGVMRVQVSSASVRTFLLDHHTPMLREALREVAPSVRLVLAVVGADDIVIEPASHPEHVARKLLDDEGEALLDLSLRVNGFDEEMIAEAKDKIREQIVEWEQWPNTDGISEAL
jgi:hypothetical protein